MRGQEKLDEYEYNNWQEVYEENARIRRREDIKKQIAALNKKREHIISEIEMLEAELKIV